MMRPTQTNQMQAHKCKTFVMSKSNLPQGDVPDLLSFDSWDFSSSTEGISTASHTTTASTNEECSILTTSSFDTSGFGDAATAVMTFPLSSPKTKCYNATTTTTVQVSVSGVIFSLHASIFQRLEKLPWKLVTSDTSVSAVVSGDKVRPHFNLDTSPDLFEMILNFLMFAKLPVLSELRTSDVEELELLAAILELHDLQQHLEKKNRVPFRCHAASSSSSSSTGSSYYRRLRTQKLQGKQHNKYKHSQPLGAVDTVMKQHDQVETNSNNNIGRKKNGPVRVVQAALMNRRLTNQQQRSLEFTHDEVDGIFIRQRRQAR